MKPLTPYALPIDFRILKWESEGYEPLNALILAVSDSNQSPDFIFTQLEQEQYYCKAHIWKTISH